ncbi:hypothetical protein CR513_32773, partial [Mucuna pruriens]
MPQDIGGNTTFNVIDLTPCNAGVKEDDNVPNLRTNSLQEGEDDAYMERGNPFSNGLLMLIVEN